MHPNESLRDQSIQRSSDNNHTALSVRVSSRHAASTNVRGNELLVEGVCVWVVDVVIDTCVIVEACRLPEFLDESVRVIVVEEEHRRVANQEEAEVISFETCIE